VHHRGIIHRDIKPANLLWTKDRTVVKIIDFGVAHLSPSVAFPQGVQDSGDNALFSENDLARRLGTPSFLAPEVVWFDHALQDSASTSSNTLASRTNLGSGKEGPQTRPSITKAIDVWSLAVTFYCFLFGHTPFNVPESENENVYHNEYMLYNQICTQDWDVDETMGSERALTGGRHPKDPYSEGFAIVKILDRMLQKDPKERVTLSELKVGFLHGVWKLC
jgi:serine/threonine protein kinase